MKTFLLMILILTACGQAADQSSSEKSPEGKDKKSFRGSIYLESKKQLPKCGEANDTQLAYVKKEHTFYVCEDSEWAEVAIEGERGTAGRNGSDAPVLANNEWIDPVTDIHWIVAGQANGTAAASYCGNGSELAPTEEIIEALQNGLQYKLEELSVSVELWGNATDVNGVGPLRSVVQFSAGLNFYDTFDYITVVNTVVCKVN